VSRFLLDVNVLMALSWPSQVHHKLATEWFIGKKRSGFSTCPLTQAAFVRLSSNPSVLKNAVTPADALTLLERITELPGHQFWPDDLPVADAIGGDRMITGHRQITDAYLIGLAAAHGGKFATLDRAALAFNNSLRIVELLQDPVRP
jgi:toxin-antitoxin system PIN domain toxin